VIDETDGEVELVKVNIDENPQIALVCSMSLIWETAWVSMTTVSAMTPAIRDRLAAVCSGESPEPTYRYSYVRTRSEGRRRSTVVLYSPVYRGDRMDQTTGKCMTWLCGDGAIGEAEFVNLFAFRHRDPVPRLPRRRDRRLHPRS
jgi:hypothetical protein